MLFGLTNAPTTFVSLINGVFKQFHDYFSIVSIDDIWNCLKSEEENVDHHYILLGVSWGCVGYGVELLRMSWIVYFCIDLGRQ